MAQGPIKENDPDAFWAFLIFMIIVMVAISYFWEDIASVMVKVRYYEAIFPLVPESISIPVLKWIVETPVSEVTKADISGSGALLAKFWRWPVLLITATIGYRLFKKKLELSLKYARKHSTKSLRAQESELWPVIKPILDKNLGKVSLDDPIEGVRQRPRVWCEKNGVVLPYTREIIEELGNEKYQIVNDSEIFLSGRTTSLLEKQLGRQWTGFESLMRHEKSLFIAFCAHLANYESSKDEKLHLKIINELATNFCVAEKELDISKIYSPTAESMFDFFLLPHPEDEKNDELKKAKTILRMLDSSHAYVRTMLMTLLQLSRKNGKLPPAWFRWLKTTDRITWYCLCDLGLGEIDMPSCIESAGVRSHWLWERRTKTPIKEPMVMQAIPGIIKELETRIAESKNEEDLLSLDDN